MDITERARRALADWDAFRALPLDDRISEGDNKRAEFVGVFSEQVREFVALADRPAAGRHQRTGTGWA
jgi:hypothetical protein